MKPTGKRAQFVLWLKVVIQKIDPIFSQSFHVKKDLAVRRSFNYIKNVMINKYRILDKLNKEQCFNSSTIHKLEIILIAAFLV